MAAAVQLRGDYEARQLRELAKRSHDANQTRRVPQRDRLLAPRRRAWALSLLCCYRACGLPV